MEPQNINTAPAEHPIVYVKQVAVSDLPDEMREQAKGVETVYAVATDEGQRLALVSDRRMAFILARQNDYTPVSVH